MPWRLTFKNLQMAFFHGHLRKVRVMLLVDLETGLENSNSEYLFLEEASIFFMCLKSPRINDLVC